MLQVQTIHKYKIHLYSKAVEMQNCIKDADMKAWIPGNYENGPKYPVPGECGSGVLFLKYKGLDIFIPGKARIGSRNNTVHTNENKNNENCKLKNIPTHTQARCNVADSENAIGKIGGGYSKTKSFSAVPLKRSVGVQWSIDDTTEVTAKPVKPKGLHRTSVETHLDRPENMKFTREPVKSNRHTKYIVTKHDVVVLSFSNNCDVVDKPCSEVCKSNVSASDDTKVVFGGGDCRGCNPNKAVVKPKPKRGYVKSLIEHYNALDAASANK